MFIERPLREKRATIARSAEQAGEHYAGEMASTSQDVQRETVFAAGLLHILYRQNTFSTRCHGSLEEEKRCGDRLYQQYSPQHTPLFWRYSMMILIENVVFAMKISLVPP
jgi:hypothetical protein